VHKATRRRIIAADRAIMLRIAATDSPVLDRVLPALSRAADHSRLWMGIAAGLAVTEDKWARRAALRGSRPQKLIVNGRRRVWLLFVGNCRYEPEGAAPSYRPDLRDGQLDIRMVDGSQPLARARLIAAVAMGTLARCRVYRAWTAPELTIRSRDGSPVQLSADGEVATMGPAVTLRKHRHPLLVYRPEM
jgi:hypothetical protein